MKMLPLFEQFIKEGYSDLSKDEYNKLPKLWDITSFTDKKVVGDVTFVHKKRHTGYFFWGNIAAFDSVTGEEIGNATYGKELPEDRLEISIEIRKDRRRQGIATSIYQWVEELTKDTVYPSIPHSSDAEAFWNQPNRKFGV